MDKSVRTLFGTLLSFFCLAASGSAETIALIGGTVIDGNGGLPITDGVVVITDKKIVTVGATKAVAIPTGCRRIDTTGKYVLPGLMDANVHLIPWPSWTYIEFLARYENNFEGLIEEAAQIGLKRGFTTVFDSMGPLRALMEVRDRINRGEVEGSRMFVAGDIVGFRAVFTTVESIKSASPAFQQRINALFELNVGPDLPWKTPEQVHDEMRKYVALGPDFVKYGATGDGQPLNSEIGQEAVLRFTLEQQRAMVSAVHEAGKIIQTHQTSAEALKSVLDAGVDMAQHCSFTGPSRISDATIQLMLAKKFYCGTQWRELTAEQQQQVRDHRFPGTDADNGKEGANYNLENDVRLIKAGVPLLVSTDDGVIDPDVLKAGGYGTTPASAIGEGEFLCMRAMRQRGMTPMMIIQAATKNIAGAYHKLDTIGTIEPGKLADIVVMDADPLQDVENMRKISMVLKEGQVIETGKLPLHPILTSSEAVNPGPVRMK